MKMESLSNEASTSNIQKGSNDASTSNIEKESKDASKSNIKKGSKKSSRKIMKERKTFLKRYHTKPKVFKSNRKMHTRESKKEFHYINRFEKRMRKEKLITELQDIHSVLGSQCPPKEEEKDLALFLFGKETFSDLEDDDMQVEKSTGIEEKSIKSDLKPVWIDEDDETYLVKDKTKSLKNCHRSLALRGEEKYSDYVKEKFTKLMGTPDWANLEEKRTKDSDEESEDELLQRTGNFICQTKALPKDILKLGKCRSLVDISQKAAMIKWVEFHPTSRVAVVAATSGYTNLYQIDGEVNSKIQSIELENFPVHMAHFSTDGCELIMGSNKFVHLYSYDMMGGKISRIPWQTGMKQWNMRRFQMSPDGKFIVINGRYGQIHLMTAQTKEWVGSLKMNGEVVAIAFNRDGTKMYSHGGTGEVYVWDMNARRCIHKFVDVGCLTGTALAVSHNEQFIATGSDSGVVNVYDHAKALSQSSPDPLKAIMNLTTEITSLKFNHTSEMLLAASSHKAEATKIVHLPSLNVFQNFPTETLKYTNALDISPNSGFMCIGNNVGTAYIYRVKHYKNY